jgi:RNA polymerase sigma factor (sigma-70 family)
MAPPAGSGPLYKLDPSAPLGPCACVGKKAEALPTAPKKCGPDQGRCVSRRISSGNPAEQTLGGPAVSAATAPRRYGFHRHQGAGSGHTLGHSANCGAYTGSGDPLGVRTRNVQLAGRVVEEAALVSGLRQGDPQLIHDLVQQVMADRNLRAPRSPALDAVCDAFRPELMRSLRRFFRGDEDTALEVWNDTLERAYYRIESFDPRRAPFKGWLHQQAKWASLDRVRADARQKAIPMADPDQLPQFESTGDIELVDPVIVALRRAFLRLSEEEQRLLFLRDVLGCPGVEIARHGLAGRVPDKQIGVYLQRARARLKTLLRSEASTVDEADLPPVDELWSVEIVAELARDHQVLDQMECLLAEVGAAAYAQSLRLATSDEA